MKIYKLIIIAIICLSAANIYSQQTPGIRVIIERFGQTAYSYFLSANRPYYGVDAYVTPKGKTSLSTGISFNNETFEIPFGVSYGIAKNFELAAGIDVYTVSYNFDGDKIRGIGDSYIGGKYKFQESEHFIHAVQGVIKIPTASEDKELGTGKVDFYLGAAQSFYVNKFGYDLSVELNLLRRRDFPTGIEYPPIIKRQIDSVKSQYNYSYEPEFGISGGPFYEFSERFSTYAGVSFSRNFKLDYNTSYLYGGFGYGLSNKTSLGLGGSYNLLESGDWIISSSFNITF